MDPYISFSFFLALLFVEPFLPLLGLLGLCGLFLLKHAPYVFLGYLEKPIFFLANSSISHPLEFILVPFKVVLISPVELPHHRGVHEVHA